MIVRCEFPEVSSRGAKTISVNCALAPTQYERYNL